MTTLTPRTLDLTPDECQLVSRAQQGESHMVGPGSLFREIHRLRRFLGDLQEAIDRHPRLLKGQQAKVAAQEKLAKDNEDTLKKLKVEVHQKEVTLRTTTGQIAKYTTQSATATTPKELEAFKNQIATAKATVARLEDEMLAQLNEIDERTSKIPELQQLVAKAREDYVAFEKAQNEKQADRQVHFQQAQEQLKQAESQLPPDHRAQYDRTVHSMGADGFASVTNGSCDACRGQITSQGILDLRQGQYALCRACGRILYPLRDAAVQPA